MENFTDTMLKKYLLADIKKDTMLTDTSKLKALIRPTRKESDPNSIFFLCIINKDKQRYRFNLGTYPAMSITEARKAYFDCLERFAQGQIEKIEQSKNKNITLAYAYNAWYKNSVSNWSENTVKSYNYIYNRHISKISACFLSDITSSFVMDFLSKELLSENKKRSALYVANLISKVLDYAVFMRWIEFNPIYKISKFLPKVKATHFYSFDETSMKEDMTEFFNVLNKSDNKIMICFFYLAFFTLLRNSEVRTIRKENITGDVLQVKTKTLEQFKQPLSRQALEVIAYMERTYGYNDNDYLFWFKPNSKGIHISMPAIFLRKLGYEGKFTVHGIRTCGRQFLQTIPTAKESIIELCLSHTGGNAVQKAYNRGEYVELRRELMQTWSDFVEECIGKNFDFIRCS